MQPAKSVSGRLGAAARWGQPRPPSRLIRIDKSAADALATIPDIARRRVASDAIRRAVADYFAPRRADACARLDVR